ncbi:MAG: S9 family peptidase [Acidobacteria bacterium]|nr:S9 family peptidase [Acidobacteriota bacterium]MBI3488718.1 S9 family peptidase [Acidobacteriota bacterium]
MKHLWITLALGFCMAGSLAAQEPKPAPAPEDPYLWLEEVTGAKALDWVKARNAESGKELAEAPGFAALKADLLKIMDSKERIAFVNKTGPYYYNFWRDEKNPQGVWRRTTLEEYRKPQPKWDVILDLDALNKAEKENWVWHGAQILKAGGWRHVLVNLSRGGADAGVVREFDLDTRAFVKGGFELPESKGSLSWIDKDSVYVSTDFGPGSMTTSGYPRIVKLWKRGTPLSAAGPVYEGKATDMSVNAYYDDTKGFERHFVYRSPAFYRGELFLRAKDGKLQKVDVPEDATARPHREWLMIEPRSAWIVNGKTYAAGSLLVAKFDDYMKGKRDLTVLFEPTPRTSLAGSSWTRHHLILNVLEDVKNTLTVLTPGKDGWSRKALPGAPGYATVSMGAVDADENDDYFMVTSGYLTPTTLLHGAIGQAPSKLKELPAFFHASGLEVTQHFAASKDGTKVPYFQIAKKGLKLDGANPTLLYGYGGFEVSLTPGYSAGIGRAWLTQGGVYVVANIRGGGEYGPRWHQAALKEKRHRAYEDFSAVAEDLIARKVTAPKHLGTQGGSNGGLLMGNMITLYPKLFGAVVCQVPLLDMKRYSHLLAGASWMAEYGDPDKAEEWAYIQTFSPYQNVKATEKYPPTLFMTSTRDDRVHPGHARKMMAKMKDLGFDVRYFENIEGGHGGAANNAQSAQMNALAFTFLWQQLK